MSDYCVGVIPEVDTIGGTTVTNFLYQSTGASVEADEYTAQDANGNIKNMTHRNFRVTVSVEAVIPKTAGAPITGQTVVLKGISIPTASATGVPTGSVKFDSSATQGINFRVTGTPNINASNTDYLRVTFDCVRHLNNSVESTSET